MIARNNIFNIRYSGSTNWKGQIGQRKGFVEFKEQSFAIRAWLILMRTYRNRHRCKTIRDIVNRYAPPSENHTENYIRFCAKGLDMSPERELSSDKQYYNLAKAMAKMETSTDLTFWNVQTVAEFYDIKICKDGNK